MATVTPIRRTNMPMRKVPPGQDTKLATLHLQWIRKTMPALYRDYIAPNLNFILHGGPPGGLLPAQSIASVGLAGLGDIFSDIGTGISNTFDMTANAVAGAAPAATSSNWWDNLLSAIPSTVTTIGNALPALGQAYFQTQAMKLNLDRAKQGLPPINTASYAPGLNVGLTPQTSNLLMYGAIGLAAVFVIMQFTKSKR